MTGAISLNDNTRHNNEWPLFIALRSLADEVHKLVEFRRDDNLGTAVTLLTHLSVVGSDGVVLTTATSRQTLRIHTVVVLQSLNH